MDSGEGRFLIGFILLGLAPLFISSSVALGVVIFIVGMLISMSSAFSQA